MIFLNRKNKIFIYVFILLTLVGCKSKSYNKDAIQKKDIGPKSLKEVSQEIDSILDYIGDIEKINLGIDSDDEDKAATKEDKAESGNSGEKSGEDQEKPGEGNISSQNSDQSSDQEKQEEPTKEEIKDEKIESTWKNINKSLEALYNSWNEYGVKAVKKGAAVENIEEVEDSLNKLTKGVEDKETLTVYNHGSRAFKALKPMYELYRDEIGGEVSTLKYMVYQYYINARKNSTNTALLFIADSEDEISKIRLKLEEKTDKDDKIDKVSFGFKNLPNALDEASTRLLILKKDSLIKSIKSLEN